MYHDKRISTECNAAVQAALDAMRAAIDAASHGMLTEELRQQLHDTYDECLDILNYEAPDA